MFTVAAATAAVMVMTRLLAPVVLAVPPASSRAGVGWLCAALPWAVALGSAMAILRCRPGTTWRDRWRLVVAGWLCGAIGCLVVASSLADAGSLFPMAVSSESWRVAGEGLIEASHGVRVVPDGTIELGRTQLPALDGQRPGALQALVALLPLTLWSPLLVAIPGRSGWKVGALTAGLIVLVVSAHAVGSGRFAAVWMAASAVPLALSSLVLALGGARP